MAPTEPPNLGPDPEVIVDHRVVGTALWGADSGRDVATMASRHHAVVVVRVREREDLTWAESLPGIGSREDFPSVDSDGSPIDLDEVDEDLPADHPKANATRPAIDPETQPPTLSRYNVEVIDILGGRIPADGFWVYQSGGVKDGIAYEVEGDPVIELGRTYVMFLSLDSNGWYWSIPWGRFEVVDGGRLLPVAEEEWEFLGFRRALEGKLLADLRATLGGLAFRSE